MPPRCSPSFASAPLSCPGPASATPAVSSAAPSSPSSDPLAPPSTSISCPAAALPFCRPPAEPLAPAPVAFAAPAVAARALPLGPAPGPSSSPLSSSCCSSRCPAAACSSSSAARCANRGDKGQGTRDTRPGSGRCQAWQPTEAMTAMLVHAGMQLCLCSVSESRSNGSK